VLGRVLDAWLSRPVDIMTAAAPRDLLRSARVSAMAQATVGALAFGSGFAVTRSPVPGIAAAPAASLTRLLVGGMDQRLGRVRLTTWSQYLLSLELGRPLLHVILCGKSRGGRSRARRRVDVLGS
jgi:hypothetical protein